MRSDRGARVRGAAITLALALAAAPAARGEIIDRVLAVVAGEIITLSDVRAGLALRLVEVSGATDATAAALDRLIERQLVLAEVDRFGTADPAPEEIEARVAAIRSGAGTPEAVARALALSGFTEARLRDHARNALRIDRYLEQRFGPIARPGPDAVLQYYREHPEEFTRGGEPVAFEEVEASLRERLATARRGRLVREWIDALKRRSEIVNLYTI